MPGYQPHKMIDVEVNEMTLQRIAPTKPDSLRCKLGVHNYMRFELTDEQAEPFVSYSKLRYREENFPVYCERCNEVSPGRRIPPKPKTESSRFSPPPMPPVKAAKTEPVSFIKPRQTHAEEVLGMEINKLIELQKVISSGDLEAVRYLVGDVQAIRSLSDHPMNFAKGGPIKRTEPYRVGEILTYEEKELLAKLREGECDSVTFVKQKKSKHKKSKQKVPPPPKPPTPPGPRVIKEGYPPERPSGIRNVKDGVDK